MKTLQTKFLLLPLAVEANVAYAVCPVKLAAHFAACFPQHTFTLSFCLTTCSANRWEDYRFFVAKRRAG